MKRILARLAEWLRDVADWIDPDPLPFEAFIRRGKRARQRALRDRESDASE